MEQLYKDGKISEKEYNNYVFYKKGFWICFAYVLFDTFRAYGLL